MPSAQSAWYIVSTIICCSYLFSFYSYSYLVFIIFCISAPISLLLVIKDWQVYKIIHLLLHTLMPLLIFILLITLKKLFPPSYLASFCLLLKARCFSFNSRKLSLTTKPNKPFLCSPSSPYSHSLIYRSGSTWFSSLFLLLLCRLCEVRYNVLFSLCLDPWLVQGNGQFIFE